MNLNIIIAILILSAFISNTNSQKLKIDSSKSISVQELTSYNIWRNQNKRIYLNSDEQLFRKLVFIDNLKKICEHNSKPNKTYTIGLNQFSDMTQEEFTQRILNRQLSKSSFFRKLKKYQQSDVITPTTFPPKKPQIPSQPVNWVLQNAVTSIKNQGSCGACWAFTAAALMESHRYLKYGGSLVDFSVQQLVDCANPSNGYTSEGCIGGVIPDALIYANKYGMMSNSQYPYTSVPGACQVQTPTSNYKPYYIQRIESTVDGHKIALMKSPVAAVVDASLFGNYSSGVFNGCSSQINVNHGVLIVGWDLQNNWVIKNSWGTNWGENGYITLLGGNSCGILSESFVITD